MNHTLPDPNPANTRQASPPKGKGIRAIDEGTSYDIVGNLIRLAREIEKGEINPARMTVVFQENGEPVRFRMWGKSIRSEFHYMLCCAAQRLLN